MLMICFVGILVVYLFIGLFVGFRVLVSLLNSSRLGLMFTWWEKVMWPIATVFVWPWIIYKLWSGGDVE